MNDALSFAWRRATPATLCNGMQRRAFTLGALGVATSFGSFGLVGCGGGGSSDQPSASESTTLLTVKTVVAPPAGFSEPLASLSVVNILGSHAVAADGSCAPQTIPDTPSLVYVEGASGTIVLIGFVDPGMLSNTVNAVSTAVVLLYFGMDGYLLADANRSQLLQLLVAHPATAGLAAVVSARLVADARVLVNADGQIATALQTAIAAIVAPPGGTSSTVSENGGAKRSVRLAAPTPALVQIDPTGQVGGTQVNVDTTVFGFTAVNSYRRYDRIYVYQSGTVVGKGASAVTTPNNPVLPFAGPIALASTEALSLFTALGDVFSGGSPYAPTTTPPIALTLAAGTDQTLYDIVVLGSSISADPPAFFSAPQYAGVVATWKSDAAFLQWKVWAIDMFGALVLDALGVRQIVANSAAIDAAAQSLFAIEDAAWMAVRAQVARGEFGVAAEAALEIAATSDIVSVQFQTILSSIVASGDAAAATAASAGSFRTTMAGFLRAIGSIAAAAIGVLGTIDMGAVIRDLSFSNQGDLWHATLVKPTVTLSPASSSVTPGARVTLSATLPTSVVGPVVYDWTQDGTFSTLSTASATANRFSKITDNVVTLVTTPSDSSTIHVTVTAFEVSSGSFLEIGKGQATVALSTGSTTGISTVVYVVSDVIVDPTSGQSGRLLYAIDEFTTVAGATSYYWLDNGTVDTFLTAPYIAAPPPVWDPLTEFRHSPFFLGSQTYNLGGGRFGNVIDFTSISEPDPFEAAHIDIALDALKKFVAAFETTHGAGVPIYATVS